MNAYRFAYRLAIGLARSVIVAFIVFNLSGCSPTGTSALPTATIELATSTMAASSTPVVTPALTPTPDTIAWKTYQNDRAGYTVEYPADWGMTEHIESDGADVTAFVPPGSNNAGIGLMVIVRNAASSSEEIPDMPNTRCQRVTVDKLPGTRCFDTIAFSTTTTLLDQGKVYLLTGSGQRLDRNIYQHFLESFTRTT